MSIEINSVTKRFKHNAALDNVSFTINENTIYGLLGRNGAGKSTLFNIIAGRGFASSGKILVDGKQAAENDAAQGKIYLMSENNMYPKSMTVMDTIRWTGEFYDGFDTEKALKIAADFELDVNKKIYQLSTGYKVIAKFILALSVNVPYVFLDEPTLGLDANHRELFYKTLISEYSESPRSFIIATHLIEEIAGIIEQVVIINNGKIIKCESTESLLSSGYTVTGSENIIDEFIKNKNVMSTDLIGAMKVAYIIGNKELAAVPEGVEVTGLNL